MIVAVIIACEIGFWVLLGLGLACRYLWNRRALSTALLVSVPLLDVILLAAAVVDIRGGATADFKHGLAAAYLAYSIVFGHSTLKWADARFHHRFGGGPPPPRPPKRGPARTRYEWIFWLRIVLAYGLAWGIVLILGLLVGAPERMGPLYEFLGQAAKVPLIALIWPVSQTIWPGKEEPMRS
ncbi:hypothetical protein OUY22_00415 [Nonomuraea sp. MCN248]|uniref:Uncharacterized protein n=1 Tax=Nonomuraea corallina TaxID=2989783 RepID=A0ABT4S3V9_9ACTN|nr:hypothetical protein [Nonomuraea corallina]MDA0631864.1 hypothetical protein [Nonomuraea corallina]